MHALAGIPGVTGVSAVTALPLSASASQRTVRFRARQATPAIEIKTARSSTTWVRAPDTPM